MKNNNWIDPHSIMRKFNLTLSERVFLWTLRVYADFDTGECKPLSNKEISYLTGISICQIRRIKKSLVEKKIILPNGETSSQIKKYKLNFNISTSSIPVPFGDNGGQYYE